MQDSKKDTISRPAKDENDSARLSSGEQLLSFKLPRRPGPKILAAGTELKSTICLLSGQQALLSEPIGNLTEPGTYRRYISLIEEVEHRLGIVPEIVAHDQHPRYMSTQYALGLGLPTVAVQHHHAHVVSVLAEWHREKPVIGICCDGVGYGTDGAAWGCEILWCEPGDFKRLGHLDYFPLVGGDAAAIENYRPAAAMLAQAFGPDWRKHVPDSFRQVPTADVDMVARLMAGGLNTPMTSSLGRAFDGVSFLLGLCIRNDREAQAPVALEQAACGDEVEPYPYGTTAENGSIRMSLAPTIRAIVQDLRRGCDVGDVSARFHETVARMLSATAEMACEMTGVSTAVLAGGCFFNQRLRSRLARRLEQRHLTVMQPRRLSFSDAGVALGQVAIAAALHERG